MTQRRKRRVLFLAFQLGPGGVVTHMHSLANGLVQRNWEVMLATRGKFGEHNHGPEWFTPLGVTHQTIPFPFAKPEFQNLAASIVTFRKLAALMRRYRPDLLHVHWRLTSPFAQMLRGLFRIPFVATLHVGSVPAGKMQRMLSFWGNRTIAVSSEVRRDLLDRFGVPETQVRTIFYGVDELHYRPATAPERREAREALKLPEDARVVALIGSDHRRKGHDVLLRALALLRSSEPKVVAVFAGDESEKSTLLNLARDIGVADHTYALGYVQSREVLWAADVLALPSRREGLPIAVNEAMLCGVIPVRTPTAGCDDQTCDGEDGFVIPFDDHEKLASCLSTLFADDALRERMSANAVRSARAKFTTTRMVDGVESVYLELIKS